MGSCACQETLGWFKSLGDSLNELAQEVDALEARIASNEQVLTVTLRATVAAQETHETEKLDALRAAVLNSALDVEPDETAQLMFVALIDRSTAAHLQLLKFLDDPAKAFSDRSLPKPTFMAAGISAFLNKLFPGWRREFYDRLAADLAQMGLADAPLHATMSEAGIWASRTTDWGKRFLRFITDPQ